ncbi:MAG: hypothetical protein FWF29_12135 [Treponema sp.]|nr:hypothetical protein [Treponema sp.]
MPTPEKMLHSLAELDPDYSAFMEQLPDELTDVTEPLPEGFADDVISLLRAERPELSKWFDMQQSNPPPAKLFIDTAIGAGLALAAIVFLLRTHIKIEGTHFSIEHKPIDSDSLAKILDVLRDILCGKSKT